LSNAPVAGRRRYVIVNFLANQGKGGKVATLKKIEIDFQYEEVLDAKTRRLIQMACAVAVGCPT
jgi:hypothetical protein